jgi:hypothetical protein
MSAYVDIPTGTVLVPAAPASAALASPSRTPWGWIVAGAALAVLIALVAATLIYERRRRREAPDTTIEPAQPLGRQLAAGAYRMRWGPSGLYVGAVGTGSNVAMVPVAQATVWTFVPGDRLGGTLLTPNGLVLSAVDTPNGRASSLSPSALFLTQQAARTSAWVPASDPSGQTGVPGTLYNVALRSCARPSGSSSGNGDGVAVVPSCAATERGWYFEAAK